MWARVARFEGDPESIDARIERLRAAIETGDVPVGLRPLQLLQSFRLAGRDPEGEREALPRAARGRPQTPFEVTFGAPGTSG